MPDLKKSISDYYFSIFGEKVKLDNFDDRLKFQKFTYTLAYFNIIPSDISNLFNWYHKGPYSSTVRGWGNEIKNNSTMELELKQLPESLSYFNSIKTDIRKVELYASLLYLKKAGYSKKDAVRQILITKPSYTLDEIEDIIAQIPFENRT